MLQRWRPLVLALNRVKPASLLHLPCRKQSSVSENEHDPAKEAKLAYRKHKEGGPAPQTIFTKIINREIPATVVHEDDKASFQS